MARNSLQVTINGKEFVSKEAKKAETSLTGLQKVGEKVNTLLKASFVAAAAGIAATTAAIAKGIKDTTALADNIDKMSQKIGISREAFQEWDFILSQNGMNIESLQTSVKTLAGAAEEASRGTETYARTFRALGLSVTDTSGSLKDQERLLFETIEALSEVENTTQRTALATDLFGRSATELAPLLNSGADSIEELRDKARSLGLVLGDETVDAGVRLTDTVDQLQRTFQAVVAKAVTPFLGVLDDMGQRLAEQVASGGGLYKFISGFVKFVAWSINTGVPILAEGFGLVVDIVKILGDEAEEVLGKIWDSIGDIPGIAQLKAVIQATIEMSGEIFDALAAGDWTTFWDLTAPALSAGLTISAIIGTAGIVGSSVWSLVQTALSKGGFLISGIKSVGIGGVIAGLSLALAVREAIESPDGGWANLAMNVGTALIGAFAAGVLTGNPTAGFMVFTIALNFKLGEKLSSQFEIFDKKTLADAGAAAATEFDNALESEMTQIENITSRVDIFGGNKAKLKALYEGTVIGKAFFEGAGIGLEDIDDLGFIKASQLLSQFKMALDINSPSKEAVKIGNFFVQGIEKGLSGMGKAGKDGAFEFSTGVRDMLGIHSLSTDGKEVGKYYVEGVAEGMDDESMWGKIMSAVDTRMSKIRSIIKKSGVEGIDPDSIVNTITGGEKEETPTPDSGGGIPALLSGFGDLVSAMASVKSIMDPLSVILSGVMDVLGPAIDTILQPIINVLRILGQTLGSILLPVFTALGFVVQKLAEGFVWFYNAVIKPVGNFIMDAFTSIGNGLIRFMNGIIWLINLIPGVNISKIATMDPQSMHLQDISLANVSAGAVGSTYSGSAPGSSTSVQSLTVNISQYFQGNVIGDGGMEAIGEFTVRALQAYQGSGGNVQVVSA